MKNKQKLGLSLVLGATFIATLIASIFALNLTNPEHGTIGTTNGVYCDEFTAFADENADTGIGGTKGLFSTDGSHYLLATALNVDFTQYKEVGYKITKTGDEEATVYSSNTYYTGICVKTGETTSKTYEIGDIFDTSVAGMIVEEIEYNPNYNYSIAPYIVSNDNVTVSGESQTLSSATLYTLNLTDVANITVEGVENPQATVNGSTATYAFAEGTKITVKADDFKTISEVKNMFVGFDKNEVDNRVGEDGVSSYTFTMPAEEVSLSAKYAEANTTFLSTGTWHDGSSYTPEGMTATVITDSTDEDLQGLSGYSFIIPDNAAATTSKAGNLTGVAYTAWGIDQDKLIKLIFKNHGNYDVTVEVAGEYFGYLASSGNITVPANSVVIEYMNYGPFSGAGATCDWQIHVREDVQGDGSGNIQLDFVASGAKRYESKVSDLIVTGGTYMQFGETADNPRVQSNQAAPSNSKDSGLSGRSWDEYGVLYIYGENNTSEDTYARFRGDMLGETAIDLKTSGTFTIYVKATNLYHAGGGKYSLVFTRGSSSLSGSYLATQTLEFTEYGQSVVYAIEIDPSKAGSSANLQFGLKKAKADGTGGKVNVLIQIATTNIFGELTA